MKKTLGTLIASTALVLLAACGGGGGDDAEASSSGGSGVVTASGDLSRDDFVQRLSAAQLKAGSAHLEMTSALMGAEMKVSGDMRLAEKVEDVATRISMDAGPMTMDIRLVDGVMYLNMGQMSGGKFIKADLDDPDNPLAQQYGSVTEQMDPAEQLAMFDEALIEFENLGDGGTIDGVETTRIRLVLDTKKALEKQLGDTPELGQAQLPEQLEYEMFVGEDDLMRKVVMDFAGSQMTIEYSQWGEPVEVQAPAESDVVEAGELPGLGALNG